MTNKKTIPKKPFNPAPIWISIWIAVAWFIIIDLDISFKTLVWGFSDIIEYFSRYTNPDFSEFHRYLKLLIQTISIATWGTFLAFITAIILAPIAARNFTKGTVAYRITRELFNFMRAIPDLLLALIFVAALGLGPLPGVLALGVHTGGFLGKFFAESLERVDSGVIEAVQAVGANRIQLIMYAGWPSILREVLGYTIYILDRNIRMATVLGLVGAGGIGLELHDTLRLFKYGQSAALIIVILVTLLAFDYVSTYIRGKLQ